MWAELLGGGERRRVRLAERQLGRAAMTALEWERLSAHAKAHAAREVSA